jgi:serine protease
MQKRISLAIVISLLLLTAIFLSTAVAQPPIFEKEPGKKPEARYVPGEIIVKFKPGVRDEVIRDLNQRHGCSVLSSSRFAGFRRLRIPKGKTVEEMVEIYSKNPNIDYAESNSIAYTFWAPNDPLYPYQWHMDDSSDTNPYGENNGGGINVEPAWDISTGEGVIVAVIDTGVAYENYENFARAPDLAQTSFVAGYDFVNDDSHPNDDNGHGTHVTGTIAQNTDNGTGAAGVAFNTSVVPVKVLNDSGSGTYADIADGIYFAADNGADVINMSLGGSFPSSTLENAVAYAYGKGVTIVCAAGNDGSPDIISYPAAYDDYCIAVGATRYDETVASYSNRGLSLDLVAPGGDLSVDQNGDGYGDGVLQQTFGDTPTVFGYWFYQGTSMASPHVAGVAALLIANGITGPDQVRDALESTAKDKGSAGWDEEYGWGIVDAYAALNYATVSNHPPVANAGPDPKALAGEVLTFDGSGSSDTDGDVTIVSYDWDFGEGSADSGMTVDHVYTAPGTYTAKLTVIDNGGLTDTDTATVTITEASNDVMHVESIDMALKTAGRNTSALSTVTILDANGIPVEGATVYGSWSGATSDADSGVTDAKGRVTLESDKQKRIKSGAEFAFAVADVVKPGWVYDPGAKVETIDSITVP